MYMYYAIWNAQYAICNMQYAIMYINYQLCNSNQQQCNSNAVTVNRQQAAIANVKCVCSITYFFYVTRHWQYMQLQAPRSRLQAMQNAIGRIQNADTDHTAHRGAVWTGPLGPRAISISIPAAYCLLLLQIAARAAKKGLGPQLAIGLLAFPFASCRTVCRADC
jgi:hypothetical protein